MKQERLFYLGAIFILIVLLALQSQCKKEITFEDCEEIAVNYCNDSTIELIDSLSRSYTELIDSMPKGDTITVEKYVYINHTTFVKNYEDLQMARARLEYELAEKQELYQDLDKTREQLDSIIKSQGVFTFDDLGGDIIQPEIETVKYLEGDEYKGKITMRSEGQLRFFKSEMEVFPKTAIINRPPSTEELELAARALKKNNFLALKGGALYIDDTDNLYWSPSIEYGHKFFLIEAGPVFDKRFKEFKGLETKAGFFIRF